MARKLLLFDIDCTLIDTGGAGMAALRQAAVDHFGTEGPPLDLAGSTDSGIVRGLFGHFQRRHTAASERAFYRLYLEHLRANLADDAFDGKVLPGVRDLLAELADSPHSVGLLTGNIALGASIKVHRYGLGSHFAFGAYGDDHWDRNQLGPIAIARSGQKFPSADVIVIGDTPKDIACARACGARAVAIGTGKFTKTELDAYEPDLCLESLASIDAEDLW